MLNRLRLTSYETVLWIDDRRAEYDAARRMLELIDGLECVFASSSEGAGSLLCSHRFDCVVTDIPRRRLLPL